MRRFCELVRVPSGVGGRLLRSRSRRLVSHQSTKSRIHQIESGFTLIELLVVASILVVLAGIGLVQYRKGEPGASEAGLKTALFNLRDGIDQYCADKGQYPATLDELVSSGYLRKVPDDPFTMSASSWQTVAS